MKYKIYKDRKKQFRFRLIADNHKFIIPTEGYHNREDVLNAIRLIKESKDAPVFDEKGQEVELFKSASAAQTENYLKDHPEQKKCLKNPLGIVPAGGQGESE